MKKSFKNYLAEGFLIVFSVLFALFISGVSDDFKVKKQKRIAIENIKMELNQNAKVLKIWQKDHKIIDRHISELINGKKDSLLAALKKKKYLDFGLITDSRSLINSILTDTAWETAKTTNIIAELDFELIEELTRTYTLQNIVVEKTLGGITDFYFSADTHDLSNLDRTLLQFNLRFNELVGQEKILEYSYTKTLKSLE
jgi:hypothetical protein